MSVYVDPIMACVPNKNWQWNKSCHMYADSLEELHAFAKAMGLKREWFQNHTRLAHYDLTVNKRYQAVRAGAIEHTSREMVEFMNQQKQRLCPFLVLIDSQEKHPFTFDGITRDQSNEPYKIHTEWRGLGASNGDYSIHGFQPALDDGPHVSVERKSVSDAAGTILGWDERRDRFERELENLASLTVAAVVVEGTLGALIHHLQTQPQRGQKTPEENAKVAYRQVLAWQQDFRVPWIFCDSRRLAELTTFRILERFWKHHHKEKSTK